MAYYLTWFLTLPFLDCLVIKEVYLSILSLPKSCNTYSFKISLLAANNFLTNLGSPNFEKSTINYVLILTSLRSTISKKKVPSNKKRLR